MVNRPEDWDPRQGQHEPTITLANNEHIEVDMSNSSECKRKGTPRCAVGKPHGAGLQAKCTLLADRSTNSPANTSTHIRPQHREEGSEKPHQRKGPSLTRWVDSGNPPTCASHIFSAEAE